ncbi:hypothetical protein PR048_027563 [Dryococelus australis]|uniref:Uncharacterized protein n=1 Tax=Dryococelus australis TaxID=614101 RepID=A0ABQ9GGW6_9NEOP|nr:hypothetical protein PR048_027563 [Dryococelus australis]
MLGSQHGDPPLVLSVLVDLKIHDVSIVCFHWFEPNVAMSHMHSSQYSYSRDNSISIPGQRLGTKCSRGDSALTESSYWSRVAYSESVYTLLHLSGLHSRCMASNLPCSEPKFQVLCLGLKARPRTRNVIRRHPSNAKQPALESRVPASSPAPLESHFGPPKKHTQCPRSINGLADYRVFSSSIRRQTRVTLRRESLEVFPRPHLRAIECILGWGRRGGRWMKTCITVFRAIRRAPYHQNRTDFLRGGADRLDDGLKWVVGMGNVNYGGVQRGEREEGLGGGAKLLECMGKRTDIYNIIIRFAGWCDGEKSDSPSPRNSRGKCEKTKKEHHRADVSEEASFLRKIRRPGLNSHDNFNSSVEKLQRMARAWVLTTLPEEGRVKTLEEKCKISPKEGDTADNNFFHGFFSSRSPSSTRFPYPTLDVRRGEDYFARLQADKDGASLLASNQGEPGSFPGRVTGFSQVVIVPDDAVDRWGSPVPPAPSFPRRSMLTLNTLNGSQDLAVKSRPNLFTHSLTVSLDRRTNKVTRPMGISPSAGWNSRSRRLPGNRLEPQLVDVSSMIGSPDAGYCVVPGPISLLRSSRRLLWPLLAVQYLTVSPGTPSRVPEPRAANFLHARQCRTYACEAAVISERYALRRCTSSTALAVRSCRVVEALLAIHAASDGCGVALLSVISVVSILGMTSEPAMALDSFQLLASFLVAWHPTNHKWATQVWSGAGMKDRGKRETPEKTRQPAAANCTIPTQANPGEAPLGSELGLPLWALSPLAANTRYNCVVRCLTCIVKIEEIWAALNIEVLRADEGKVRRVWCELVKRFCRLLTARS